MCHTTIALAVAEARVTDLHTAADRRRSAVSHRRRRSLPTLLLGLATIAACVPAGALAQPADDVTTPAGATVKALDRDHTPSATPGSITFTNPLGRSRGPGAGAGLL